jgi:hypothetical protein
MRREKKTSTKDQVSGKSDRQGVRKELAVIIERRAVGGDGAWIEFVLVLLLLIILETEGWKTIGTMRDEEKRMRLGMNGEKCSLRPQCDHRVDLGGAAGGDERREEHDGNHRDGRDGEHAAVDGAHAEQYVLHRLAGGP